MDGASDLRRAGRGARRGSRRARGGVLERVRRTLLRAREIDERVRALNESLAAGYETARLSPTRRRFLAPGAVLERQPQGGACCHQRARPGPRRSQRGSAGRHYTPGLAGGRARPLAGGKVARGLPGTSRPARRYALEAVREATEILKERHDLSTSVLVGQIRSAAVDLFRSTGMDQATALQAFEEAAGHASEIG